VTEDEPRGPEAGGQRADADRQAAVGQSEEARAAAAVEQPVDDPAPREKGWWQRPTVRALRRQEEQGQNLGVPWDDRQNSAARLPADETVHLGGVVLCEAFTPSTVSALYEVLRNWPDRDERRRDGWVAELDRSRSGAGWGGWHNLGVVRPPGEFIWGNGYTDGDLPDSVAAVWLQLDFVMPSVAVVVATFTFKDEAADMSALLRRDYETQVRDVRMRVYGKLGRLRARLPWSRPKWHGMSASVSRAEDEKRRACEQLMQIREAECWRWFTSRFRGRLACASPEARPVIRLIFTEHEMPFKNRSEWFRPLGLDWGLTVYRSVDIPGWALKDSQWPYSAARFVLTMAARRGDAAHEPTKGESGEGNWYLTQRFGQYQSPLAARYALHALLALYGERLAKLRDGAGVRRWPRRPVRDARALDSYLTSDGLDAATITSDVGVWTTDLRAFRRNVPEYTEDLDGLPAPLNEAAPREFVPGLNSALRERAARLAADTENTTGNIRSSADLRQAIANTLLQRTVVFFSVVAVVVAVIGLVLAGTHR
jgi:hypothetical protein